MPSKIQHDENLWFLYICLQQSDMKSIDFASVASLTNLKAPAARMRFVRLKKQIEAGQLIGTNGLPLLIPCSSTTSSSSSSAPRAPLSHVSSPRSTTPFIPTFIDGSSAFSVPHPGAVSSPIEDNNYMGQGRKRKFESGIHVDDGGDGRRTVFGGTKGSGGGVDYKGDFKHMDLKQLDLKRHEHDMTRNPQSSSIRKDVKSEVPLRGKHPTAFKEEEYYRRQVAANQQHHNQHPLHIPNTQHNFQQHLHSQASSAKETKYSPPSQQPRHQNFQSHEEKDLKLQKLVIKQQRQQEENSEFKFKSEFSPPQQQQFTLSPPSAIPLSSKQNKMEMDTPPSSSFQSSIASVHQHGSAPCGPHSPTSSPRKYYPDSYNFNYNVQPPSQPDASPQNIQSQSQSHISLPSPAPAPVPAAAIAALNEPRNPSSNVHQLQLQQQQQQQSQEERQPLNHETSPNSNPMPLQSASSRRSPIVGQTDSAPFLNETPITTTTTDDFAPSINTDNSMNTNYMMDIKIESGGEVGRKEEDHHHHHQQQFEHFKYHECEMNNDVREGCEVEEVKEQKEGEQGERKEQKEGEKEETHEKGDLPISDKLQSQNHTNNNTTDSTVSSQQLACHIPVFY